MPNTQKPLKYQTENSAIYLCTLNNEGLCSIRDIVPTESSLEKISVLLQKIGRALSSLHDGRSFAVAVLASLAMAVAKRWPSFRSICSASYAAAKTYFHRKTHTFLGTSFPVLEQHLPLMVFYFVITRSFGCLVFQSLLVI